MVWQIDIVWFMWQHPKTDSCLGFMREILAIYFVCISSGMPLVWAVEDMTIKISEAATQ
jgi:hypothetical protein